MALLLQIPFKEKSKLKTSKFALTAIMLILVTMSGWASDKMKANIRIFETVKVGSAQLNAGEYTLSWTGSGSNAQVTFSQGKKVIATVPAQVAQARSGYTSPTLETDSRENTLTKIALPKQSFSFTGSSDISGN